MKRGQRLVAAVSLRQALSDEHLLGKVLAGDSWAVWRVILIAAMGESLSTEERKVFTTVTQRDHEPHIRVDELVAVVGRRGGKSRALSAFACYLAALIDHRHLLVPGERGVVLLIAPDQRQAKIALDYCHAVLTQSPILRQLIANRTQDAIEMTNRISIEVRAATARRLRGPTYIAVLADEAAFWMSDETSSNPDVAILDAVRPGLATTGGPLIIASSPYARKGVLWETHKRHFGPNGDPLILVAQGASRDFNPSLAQSVVDRALERDRAAASAEYLGQFRSDVEALVLPELVSAVISRGTHERPRVQGTRYFAFTDPSGGSADSMTLAIAHNECGAAVLDAVRERRPPFSPDDVVAEFSAVLRSYCATAATGDRYAGEWPRERFRAHGISYRISESTKSELYRDLLPLLNSGRVDLLDVPRLENQLIGLERRTSRAGRDVIDHAPGGHDDVANAVAGACLLAVGTASRGVSIADYLDDPDEDTVSETARRRREWEERFPFLMGLS